MLKSLFITSLIIGGVFWSRAPLTAALERLKPLLSHFQQETLAPALEKFGEKILAPLPLVVRGGVQGLLSQEGVIYLTNIERGGVGEPELRENNLLDRGAKAKLDDLFARQYFEHVSPSGAGPGEVAHDAGYEYIVIGENLALGDFANDAALVKAWMDSPGHRANILNKRFTEIGVAVGKGKYQGEEVWIGVQEFGLPLSACPSADDRLLGSITLQKGQIADERADLDNRKKDIEATNQQSPGYNQKVQEYNALVKTYNADATALKNDIDAYNAGVRTSNACRDGN